jgi:diguanylate cyclase (GGDEF)-like protein
MVSEAREALARDWLRVIIAVCFVPGRPAEARAALADLLDEATAALRAEPFDAARGRRIGAELVDLRMAAPPVLGASLRFLGDHLPPGDRVPPLLEQVANGFTEALRDAALVAAEEMNLSEKVYWRARERDGQERFRTAVMHDAVTGLPNRAHLREHLDELLKRDRTSVGLCLLSIDGFADLNDALGHHTGDDLLDSAARRLRRVVRDLGPHFLAHLGGEQFAIALTGTHGIEPLIKTADAVRRELATISLGDVDGYHLRITATAGIAETDGRQPRPDDLLRDAHLALRWAQQDHCAWAAFDPGRAAADRERHLRAAAMPAALERGEFRPYFQPLYRLSDRTTIGVEALARWQRGDGSTPLGPRHFIALAERTGLIQPLGRTLLDQACRLGAGRPGLVISVNLSPLQLDDPGFVPAVADTLHRTGLPNGRLQLEITESAAVERHRDVLRRLADLGIRLAIDDFGTGYSSLAALATLPVSNVKLAAEFLAAVGNRRTGVTAALRHTIRLCHDLGMTVTAEGIETAAQEEVLRDLDCDYGQGFHYAAPAPVIGGSRPPAG